MRAIQYPEIVILCTLLLQIIGLTFSILIDPYILRKQRKARTAHSDYDAADTAAFSLY